MTTVMDVDLQIPSSAARLSQSRINGDTSIDPDIDMEWDPTPPECPPAQQQKSAEIPSPQGPSAIGGGQTKGMKRKNSGDDGADESSGKGRGVGESAEADEEGKDEVQVVHVPAGDTVDLTNLPSSPASIMSLHSPPPMKKLKLMTPDGSSSTSSKASGSKLKPASNSKSKPLKGKTNGEMGEKEEKVDVKGKGKGKATANGESSAGGKKGSTSDMILKSGSGLVTLNRKKKSITIDQGDQSSVILSYTPYVTLLLEFHDFMSTQPDSAEVDLGKQEEFWPLLVMLGQESSISSKAELVTYLRDKIKPADLGGESGPDIDNKTFKQLIDKLFDKVAYGLRKDDFDDLAITDEERDGITLSSGLRVIRWEARDLDLFPQKSTGAAARMKLRDLMLERRNKREQARKELLEIVDGLEDEEKRELAGLSKAEKGAGKKGGADRTDKVKKESEKEGDGKEDKKRVKKPKEETEEQKAKRLAKEEKQRKKQEAEDKIDKQKRAGASFMSSFLSKAPAPVATSSTSNAPRGNSRPRSMSTSSRASSSHSVPENDFTAVFKQFYQASNVSLAPINRFKEEKEARSARGRKRRDSEASGRDSEADPDMDDWTAADFLGDFNKAAAAVAFDRHSHHLQPVELPLRDSAAHSVSPRKRRASSVGIVQLPPPARDDMKSRLRYCSVKQLIDKANENGDGDEARRYYKTFKDVNKFWKKTLKFHEDSRPPYEGTWTRGSAFVGPRRVLGIDPILDYSIDEGLDWEPEDPAEVELGSDQDDDEDNDADSEDGSEDLAGWMVGDDEIEFEDGAEANIDSKGGLRDPNTMEVDVYTEVGKAGSKSKGQRFSRLVQTTLGPFWEDVLCEVKPKAQPQYSIHLLNDTPSHAIDPFTFKAQSIEPVIHKDPVTYNQSTLNSTTPAIKRVLESGGKPSPSVPSPSTSTPGSARSGPPKTPFPPALLPEFLQAIEGSEKTKAALVQDLISKFSDRKDVTQAAIKWTFDQVAVRQKKGSGKWRTGHDALTATATTSA